MRNNERLLKHSFALTSGFIRFFLDLIAPLSVATMISWL